MNYSWPVAETFVNLQEGEVHVWCADLEVAADQLMILEGTLSTAEVRRANRFRFSRHQRRYIAGRGILRELAGHYLDKSPNELDISYSEYDKPFLSNNSLRFNLSHSEDMALFAFCLTADIGIDLEKIRHLKDAESIAERYFSAGEFGRFMALPVEDRNEAFFTCWTRKEAFIKAVGEGLSYPLADFDVTFLPGEQPRFNKIRQSSEEAARWSLYPLSPLPGYVAALVVKGKQWQLSCRQYSTF